MEASYCGSRWQAQRLRAPLSGSPKENGEGRTVSVWGERMVQPAQAGVGRVVSQHLATLGRFKGIGGQS